jgi:AcrR family transcriptional regulator
MTHTSSFPSATSRRERRAAARRADILDAAAAVFSQHGYENATTREIADRADVSEGTLYNYFANKQALFLGVADAFADSLVAAIDDVAVEDVENTMTRMFADRFRSGRERRLLMMFLYKARVDENGEQRSVHNAISRLVAATEARVREAIEAGTMRPVNPAVAAATLNAAIMGFAILYELSSAIHGDSAESDNAAIPPELLGEAVTDIFLNGLSKN